MGAPFLQGPGLFKPLPNLYILLNMYSSKDRIRGSLPNGDLLQSGNSRKDVDSF